MWFSIVCNDVVFISSLNHSDLDMKFQEEFNLCSSQRPWEKDNKNECVSGKYTTGQCPFHISLKKKISFYSSHPNVLISICGMLSKGLFSMIYIFFCNNENLIFFPFHAYSGFIFYLEFYILRVYNSLGLKTCMSQIVSMMLKEHINGYFLFFQFIYLLYVSTP
jgi:hypothetical protein